MTPAVGGGGGASRAAAEGAGPGAWRRGLGLSVPRPPPPPQPPPRFLTCGGRVAASAAARLPPSRHPEPPPAVPARCAGKARRVAELSRPLLGFGPPRGRPLRAVSAPRLPWPPGGGPGGRDDSPPQPPAAPGAAPAAGSPGRASEAGRGAGAEHPLPGRLHNRRGWGAGVPSRGPAPHLCPRRAPGRRAETQRDSGGPESFTLWSAFVDIPEMRGDGG